MSFEANKRNLHIVPGVSACGKTTVANYLARKLPDAKTVVGYTTRQMRQGEVDGQDYHFRSLGHFETTIGASDKKKWRASKVNNHYYYNNDADTLPNDDCSTRILPVAFSTLVEVLDDYSPIIGEGIITVVPIVVHPADQEKWMQRSQPQRPTRNLRIELKKQEEFLSSMPFDGVFTPIWDLETDCSNYLDLYKSILAKKLGEII